ncbi:pre-mRNA-splicing factor Slu7-like isoform 1-T1 [Glossina fuscipes fuscipes]
MVRGSMFIYWLSLLSWSCYKKEYEKKKEQFKSSTKEHIVEQYGGEEHLQAPPKSLLLAQTEDYIEYSRSGKVIKGMEKPKARSIYEEDIYLSNRTTVWGSYWNGRWGYKCCKSFIRNSYCVGAKEPEVTADLMIYGLEKNNSLKGDNTNREVSEDSSKKSLEKSSSSSTSSSSSENEEELQKRVSTHKKTKKKLKKRERRRMKKLIKKEKKRTEEQQEALNEKIAESLTMQEIMDDRKRHYNSMYDIKAPSEHEIEEWQRKRTRAEDPMLQFIDK